MTSDSFETKPSTDIPVILIAEDDEGQASLIERNLKRCGINTAFHRLRDGQEVLDFLHKVSKSTIQERAKPHLLFLDGHMPKISGQEVLQHIHNLHTLKALPLTIVSTTDDSQERDSFQALGCMYHLNKPVEIEALRQVLNQIHSQHQSPT
jgi:CheY-like chemotaxis protein